MSRRDVKALEGVRRGKETSLKEEVSSIAKGCCLGVGY